MIEEIKLYLRLDEDYDDLLLQNLVNSAILYLKNAGVKDGSETDLYNLAIKMLVLHWYENREIVGKADKLAFSLDSIITQLKYCYEV